MISVEHVNVLISLDAGNVPDRELTISLNLKAKALDQRALAIEDQSQVRPDHKGADVSQEQLEIWDAQRLISKVEDGLYISGYDALENNVCLADQKITHVLSVCQYYLPVRSSTMIHDSWSDATV